MALSSPHVELHGKTVEQQERTQKTKLSNELKDKARPVGMGLFHADQMIATFISSHRKAMQIMHAGATLIVQWIRRWINNDEAIERMQARQRKDLLETDGWKKERRHQ
jgi:hypothetical protein